MKLVWLQPIHSLQTVLGQYIKSASWPFIHIKATHTKFNVSYAGCPTSVNILALPMWAICNVRLCFTQNTLCSSSCRIRIELESLHGIQTSATESSPCMLHHDKPGTALVQPIWLWRLSSQCCSYVQHMMHTLRTSSRKKQTGTVSFALPPSA